MNLKEFLSLNNSQQLSILADSFPIGYSFQRDNIQNNKYYDLIVKFEYDLIPKTKFIVSIDNHINIKIHYNGDDFNIATYDNNNLPKNEIHNFFYQHFLDGIEILNHYYDMNNHPIMDIIKHKPFKPKLR